MPNMEYGGHLVLKADGRRLIKARRAVERGAPHWRLTEGGATAKATRHGLRRVNAAPPEASIL
jgi:hypothetical protein